MKLEDIVNQMRAVIPRETADFSLTLTISSLTRVGSTATAIATSSTGLSVNDKVFILDAKTPLQLSSLTRTGSRVFAIAAAKHNLLPNQDQVEVDGANETDYNGTFDLVWEPEKFEIDTITIVGNVATVTTKEDHGFIVDPNFEIETSGVSQAGYNQRTIILSAPTSTTFTYTVEGISEDAVRKPGQLMVAQQKLNALTFIYDITTTPSSPATGTIYQLSTTLGGYNGYKTVTATPSGVSFEYAVESSLGTPVQGLPKARIKPTITANVTYERALKFYTTGFAAGTSKKWLIATSSGSVANKSNRNQTDATTYGNQGYLIREQSIQDLTIYLFLPAGKTSDELDYIKTRDSAEDYKKIVFKSLLGFRPPATLFEGQYSQLMFLEDGIQTYDGGVYVHFFKFQATVYVNQEDAIDPSDLSAFRLFDFNVLDTDGNVVLEIDGEVDQEN